MKYFVVLVLLIGSICAFAQNNLVTYAGNAGNETFYDVTQLSDGTFLVCGYSADLEWVDASVPRIALAYTAAIPNAQGSNRYGILLHLGADLQTILHLVHFPQGAVEDIRFIKTNARPYQATGDLYISCNTSDSDNNNGGYIIAKLNGNFVTSTPSALEWGNVVWAKSGPKDYHPWDVTSDGRVYYISGEAHGYDWSAMYCLNENGQRMVVENWRTHWLSSGEWHGSPASTAPGDVNYSGIVLKSTGRCDLRSWTEEEYNAWTSDGNGGMKKGKWPMDILFNGPCDNNNPQTNGPGYTGYSQESCCPVYGGSCVVVDRRNNDVYIGMNMKSYANFLDGSGSPDFEPAVLAMDDSGMLRWWSRLYHEVTPQGDTMQSVPDQYVDALAIDYTHDMLVVGARAHGNNVENLWEGNTIAADPSAFGFQNRFTGTASDLHESWLGKLSLTDGQLRHSTYMAEYAEGTSGLGSPHTDPNLDGWPDPNQGWPNVNTTRMAKNALKVTSSGDVCVAALGRRTITTANAYQKMVLPQFGGQSCWNSFVRVYENDLHLPKYSSLVVGQWDTLTQAGGGNTELFGIYKTANGIVAVGRQSASDNGIPNGEPIPVINVPQWGANEPLGESAILVYYKAANLIDDNDGPAGSISVPENISVNGMRLSPNPASNTFRFSGYDASTSHSRYQICDITGKCLIQGNTLINPVDVSGLSKGLYLVNVFTERMPFTLRLVVE